MWKIMSYPDYIPVIDMSAARDGGPRLENMARQVYEACTGSGFFYVEHHGIPDDVIAAAVDAYHRFFRLPQAEKARVSINRAHRGFSGLGDALMYGAAKPDYKEFYTVGLELGPDDPEVLAGQPLRGSNNWPDSLPGFRHAIERYFQEAGRCGKSLLHAVAVSLGQPADFFESRYRKRLQRTQGVYYPPLPATADPDIYGVSAHSDYGCITLLWQDEVGGLEVLHKSGSWVSAVPLPNTLVVNVGDLLARWSNDRFASTNHRVVNRSGRERFSIATFYDPTFDSIVDPMDFGVAKGESLYEPTAAGDHIVGRIDRSFGYRKTNVSPKL
jgi:isopenicillin N synthase-like dioxygenase